MMGRVIVFLLFLGSSTVSLAKETKKDSLMKELLQKEKRLKATALKIRQKEEVLKKNKEELNRMIQNFNKRQQDFIGCMDSGKEDKKKRANHLVKIIEGMKPSKAADLLSVQEANISVEILGRLPASKTSKIFNSMDKEISARLQRQYINMKK